MHGGKRGSTMHRLFAFVCVVVLLQGGAAMAADIALVPLDSRPANTYFPVMIAQMAGLSVDMPPEIDNFLIPGDGRAIGDWLLDTDADAYVISASMLAYGGLIASRVGDMSLNEARQRVAVIEQLREQRPQATIFVYDIIQRLAITVTDSSLGGQYGLVHEWAVVKDQVDNRGRVDLAATLADLEERIWPSVMADYLAARERNHRINTEMIRLVADGTIDYLILAQDDAALAGLHRAERDRLAAEVKRLDVGDRVTIFPGADEVDMVLISRYITERYGLQPEIDVVYRGADGDRWVAPFEDITFGQNVSRHLQAAGAVLRTGADNVIYAVTPGGDTDRFVQAINADIAAGRRVTVADVAVTNTAEPAFTEALFAQADLLGLAGYAGWNTAGNTLGIALGQAIAALARETLTGEARLQADTAFVEFLLSRFAKDYHYKVLTRPGLEGWVGRVGLDPWHIAVPHVVEQELANRLTPRLNTFYAAHVAGRQWNGYVLPEHAGWDVSLAWPRLFEIRVEPRLQLEPVEIPVTISWEDDA